MTCLTLPLFAKLPVSSLLNASLSVLRNVLSSKYDVVSEDIIVDDKSIHIARVRSSTTLLDAITPEEFAIDERLPYWSELWPSSLILAEHIVGVGVCSGARVLDLGCGLGLAGIFAAITGGRVHMTDYEYDALLFSAYNIRINIPVEERNRISLGCFDWRSSSFPSMDFDIVIASDVLYERKNFVHLLNTLNNCMKADGMALFSDPDRAAAIDFLAMAFRNGYVISSKTYVRDLTPSKIRVYTLRRSPSGTQHNV